MKVCLIAYKFAKVGSTICKTPSKKIAKDFIVVAELAKFRQIWSHCTQILLQAETNF